MMNFRYIAAFILILAVSAGPGCDNGPGSEAETHTGPAVVGVEPVKVQFIEQASYNIPAWLSGETRDRVLVWFSAYDCTNPVPDEQMARINTIISTGDFGQLVLAGDAMYPGNLYSASNMNSLAHSLGIVRELIWVIPGFSNVNQEDFDMIKSNMKTRFPERSGEIDALILADNEITGTLAGMPLKIVTLEYLRVPDEPVLVSIDASFIYALYSDESSTKSLQFVAGMFQLMGEAHMESEYVSIVGSNEDMRCPYKLRALAGYLKGMIEDPEIAKSDPPKLWSERSIAWTAEQKDVGLAVPIYKNIILNYPDDAASRYDLADAYFKLGRLDDCGKTLAEAVAIDPGYRGAFSDFAARLASEGRKDDADRLFSMMPPASRDEG